MVTKRNSVDLHSVHSDDVSNLEDFWMILQFLTEDGAADLLVGLISNLQAGAEVFGKKDRQTQGCIHTTSQGSQRLEVAKLGKTWADLK